MNRRGFLKRSGLGAGVLGLGGIGPAVAGRAADPITPAVAGLTDPKEIEARARQASPLAGGKIPGNLAERLGATHYDGRYCLTQKPYLVEGAEALQRLGMKVGKFWLQNREMPGYGYNSQWNFVEGKRLVEVVQHPYYVEALALPFKTIVFEIIPVAGARRTLFETGNDFAEEESQFHELALHLLKGYSGRDITFILQHWEGDWMLRKKTGGNWQGIPEAEQKARCESFIGFLAARQRGVERARREAGPTRARVYHAAEVNRVWDGTKGIVTLTTHVLPHVALDLVSWSSYDGVGSAVNTWQGIEFIKQRMKPSPVFGRPTVYIGEIGKPENLGSTKDELLKFWDRAMAVFFALDIPWIVHWELYCNEPKDGSKDRRQRKAEELRGFWLLRPDGSLSHAATYFKSLLEHVGGTLPKSGK